MDWSWSGVQMIPRFTMESAMPSALVLFVAGPRRTRCDFNHSFTRDTVHTWSRTSLQRSRQSVHMRKFVSETIGTG